MVMRERARERDTYEEVIAYFRAERERSLKGQVVVRGDEMEWVQTRQALVKHYLRPSRHSGLSPKTALDDWRVFVNNIKQHSGKHRHQGGLVIFALEGEGHSVVAGESHDWEAGDLLLLPLKPGGVEHQHFNRSDERPAKWIAFYNTSVFEWGASEMIQLENHPDFRGSSSAVEAVQGNGTGPTHPGGNGAPGQPSAAPAGENLLEWFYALRDRQVARQAKARPLVRGRDLSWELNRQGRMKWYLHPAFEETATRSMIVFVQELPAGSRSGVQRTPGGSIVYVLQGRGYTLLDGERHDWQAEDCLNIPIRANGVVIQHVNLDPNRPASFIQTELNLVDALGVNRGSAFEQLEPAPEWVTSTRGGTA